MSKDLDNLCLHRNHLSVQPIKSDTNQNLEEEKICLYLPASIIAWRLFWLSRYCKQDENASCLTVLTEDEWKILYRKAHKTKKLPQTPPLVKEVFIWIAKLGGYWSAH